MHMSNCKFTFAATLCIQKYRYSFLNQRAYSDLALTIGLDAKGDLVSMKVLSLE